MSVRALLVAMLVAGTFAYAPFSPPDRAWARNEPSEADARLPGLAQRLASLDTSDAQACFLLAEEFAFEFTTEPGRAMARTLFVLAHEADRAPGKHRGLGRHVYTAMASIARDDAERRMLLALASSDGGRIQVTTLLSSDDTRKAVSEGEFMLAEAIGLARGGDGRAVRERLRRPSVQAALAGLGDDQSFIRELLEHAEDGGVCPTCRNRRVVRDHVDGPQRVESVETLCPICRGNPGPKLSAKELARTLDVEARLLGASASSWSAQRWLDGGRTFQDPDPSELAARYGVDSRRTRWVPDPLRPQDPFAGAWGEPVATPKPATP